MQIPSLANTSEQRSKFPARCVVFEYRRLVPGVPVSAVIGRKSLRGYSHSRVSSPPHGAEVVGATNVEKTGEKEPMWFVRTIVVSNPGPENVNR